jgi:hypothetical protein
VRVRDKHTSHDVLWPFTISCPPEIDLSGCCPCEFETQAVVDAVSGAENGDSSAVQAACNALAFVRCVVNSPKLRGGLGYALMLRVLLLPVLQSVAKAGKKECHAAVCLELALLVQASLPAAELLPPVANGSFHPGPHHSVPAHAALGWYALQQGILCSLQVGTDVHAQSKLITCCTGEFCLTQLVSKKVFSMGMAHVQTDVFVCVVCYIVYQ